MTFHIFFNPFVVKYFKLNLYKHSHLYVTGQTHKLEPIPVLLQPTPDNRWMDSNKIALVLLFALGEARKATWKMTGQFANFTNLSILNFPELKSVEVKRIWIYAIVKAICWFYNNTRWKSEFSFCIFLVCDKKRETTYGLRSLLDDLLLII